MRATRRETPQGLNIVELSYVVTAQHMVVQRGAGIEGSLHGLVGLSWLFCHFEGCLAGGGGGR